MGRLEEHVERATLVSEPLRNFLGEFLGTMILILLGDGVVAGVLLNRSKAQNAGWMVIAAGWAFAVMAGVFTAMALGAPGAINPVGPIADLALGKITPDAALPLVAGEFLGAFSGAVLVFLHYLPHWGETADPGLKLAVFSTGPAIRNPVANFVSEVIGTFVLVFVATAIAKVARVEIAVDPGHPVAVLKEVGPPLVGALVWGIGLSLGGTTGYAINPARDLGPRVAHFVLPIPGKGDSDWGYAWVPVLGPIVGGLIAAVLLRALNL
jgi:glycerol uptake facilitator protein